MRIPTRLTFALAAVSALSGCATEPAAQKEPTEAVSSRARIDATTLQAGAAESYLNLPVGVPQAGYTGRLVLGNPGPDRRTSPYTTEFVPSAGVQTRIPIKVVWLQNGTQNLVIAKVDICYSFDGLLFQVTDAISKATGIDVTDKVVLATNHSHASYGDFSMDASLFLGSDQYNTEIADRFTRQVTAVAQSALADLAPASIGVGFDPNFDPIGVDQIFRDRRGENDDLVGVNGQVLGPGYKDPRLTLIRIDHSQGTSSPSDDDPIALIHSFPIHGTILGEDNYLLSVEAPGYSGLKVQEMFNKKVVVMHLQGSTGDQSPAGHQSDFARMEYIGNVAAPKIKTLWDNTTTASGSISVDFLTRSIRQDRDEMAVTRGGTTDYRYTPFTKRYQGDEVVYNSDGSVKSPIDEFDTQYGAALCGGDDSMLYIGKLFGWRPTTTAYPYTTCGNVDEVIRLMQMNIWNYDLDWVTFPLPSAQSTVISTLKMGPVPIYTAGVGQTTDSLVVGFFPGEPVSLYSDTFRKELKDNYGYQNTVTVGYSQDHEGYLLTLEDWLKGGYEPEINQWGPIQGEYVLEQMVKLAGQFGIDDPNVPATSVPRQDYTGVYYDLNPAVPDVTADAGTVPSRVPSYLYTYDGTMPLTPQPAAQIERVTGVATFLWKGGDSAVDLPDVVLERETTPGSGVYQTVNHPSGRPWSNALGDIILTYTPDPLADSGSQTHYWLASWQAVADQPNLNYSAGVPTGSYRFRVTGQALTAAGGSYPWPTVTYSLTSEPFQVTTQTGIVVTPSYASGKLSVTASYPAATHGYRLISMSAADQKEINPLNQGANSSVTGQVAIYTELGIQVWKSASVTFTTSTGISSATVTPTALSPGNYTVAVTDVFGNLGQAALTVN